MQKHLLLFLFVTFMLNKAASGQNLKAEITGKVTAEGEGVSFAAVGLKGTSYGTTADENGNFTIKNIPAGNYELLVNTVGFQPYQKRIGVGAEKLHLKIELQKATRQLQEVVVSGTMKETYVMQSPVHVEVYTPKLFQKNPTPSVFEALQMVNGVQPQLNCNVCNTGDIHINGMEGPYTMVTIDGMPIVSSLGSVYGLSGIPNSLIQRVEVVKGPASTLYGSEAVGGLINIITKSPKDAPLVSADLMATSHREFNADLAVKSELGNAQSLLGINAFTFQDRRDVNHDNFTDITLQERISVFNKWSFGRKENRLANLAARYLYEDRWGGEMQWQPEFRGGDSIYGESIYTKRLEVIGSYELPLPEKISLQFSYNNHRQNSAYGNLLYLANQHIAFAQLLWNKSLKRHEILVGLPFRYTFYDDNTPGTQKVNGNNQPQQLYLPGIFVQNEISLSEKLTSMPGIRFDYNSTHGGIFSPRLGFKFSPNNHNVFRLNAGNGYRVVNLFTEDHAALTGSREVVILENLKPERSWNASLNYQKFIDLNKGYLNVDGSLFYTYFTNRIMGDFLTDPNQIIYRNLQGYAISRGGTFNADWMFNFPLKLNAGTTLMEVYTVQNTGDKSDEKQPQLHAPKVSATYAVSYTFGKPGITVDYTGRLYGPMHLPVLENDFRSEKSPWFVQDNVQVTKKFKNHLEVYFGIKNLYNFLPENPLMRPFDPFDKHTGTDNPHGYTFDTTYNYAPMQGRRGFVGIRWQLQAK
ncbi:TonB-dependent receptor [Adhaeribacter soli]|uniref:TonB-dependent receptor n=1 Tax=Adhaeribacter soli TaxID=2607655 RepID=A0A5N1IJX8_9BACT|nr:TonB-dependent receptor [Adhaeribacter soli]KAA9326053.1 TonB-dependent receptor [Adhaeribacter soli]